MLRFSILDLRCRFDAQSLCVFVGDCSGQIAVLKISRTSFELLTILKGHTGIVASTFHISFFAVVYVCRLYSLLSMILVNVFTWKLSKICNIQYIINVIIDSKKIQGNL